MKVCFHEWEITSNPKHLRYDQSGMEVVIAMCKCKKCLKVKRKKFIGHIVGNLFS